MRLFASRNNPTGSLRDVINASRNAEELKTIPDQLAALIKIYDTISCEPMFRQAIFQMLSSSTRLATIMSDATYSAQDATAEVSRLMVVCSEVLEHLNASRPKQGGFSILFPDTKKMYETIFTTEIEAERRREELLIMGVTRKCFVVPIEMRSGHAIQPTTMISGMLTRAAEEIKPGRVERLEAEWNEPPSYGPDIDARVDELEQRASEVLAQSERIINGPAPTPEASPAQPPIDQTLDDVHDVALAQAVAAAVRVPANGPQTPGAGSSNHGAETPADNGRHAGANQAPKRPPDGGKRQR